MNILSAQFSSIRSFITLLLIMCSFISYATEKAPITVSWEVGQNDVKPNHYSNTFTITNVSGKTLKGDWSFFYNNFSRKIELPANSQVVIDEIRPSYYRMRPSKLYKPLAKGEKLKVDMITRGSFINYCYGPDGGHFSSKSTKLPIAIAISKPVMNNSEQWSVAGRKFAYPDGNYMYDFNAAINPEDSKYQGNDYDIFPSPKMVMLKAGNTIIPSEIEISVQEGLQNEEKYLLEKLKENDIVRSKNGGTTKVIMKLMPVKYANGETYNISIENNTITIQGATNAGVLNGVKTLIAVIEKNKTPMSLKNVTIIDYPDLEYRGMMLDISRNFTSAKDLCTLIDRLASYKINRLHFHFCDDESWRLEIPGLPELTKVGSRKGMTLDEHDFMVQTFAGNGNPNDLSTTANGCYTRKQFIDILKYANQRGVQVIPEIESPGHARAAIISMKNRYRNNIKTNRELAEQYKIWDEADSSKYTSAQSFHDNIMNVAQEGTYNFMEKVVDELILMYREAGVEVPSIHIGGDEVPHGSWEGSPDVKAFMAKNGMTNVHQASEYFLNRVTKMIASKGVKVSGWQEVAMNHKKELDSEIAPRFDGVYVWSTIGNSDTIPYSVANNNYPVILCNVNNFYVDMSYNRHQYEPGLNWGAYIDEFASWNAQPFNIYRTSRYDIPGNPINLAEASKGKIELKKPLNIKGVQAQLFSETIRGYDMVEYYVFPKIFGLVERGWNASPAWGKDYDNFRNYDISRVQYNLKIGTQELPRLRKKNSNFRIGQPGLKIIEGLLHANTQYPGAVVRYTDDGSEPTATSKEWNFPIACKSKLIKAKAFYLGKQSVTTYLFTDK
ncbi:MAG: family 20 glycosylhydrolase [Muribaculaceae bacterium]